MNKTILVTGGAGFIGSALVRYIIKETNNIVINVDKLTYAGNLNSLESVAADSRYIFEKVDICDLQKIKDVFYKHKPDFVMHLAAESHVDRSIDGPFEFIKTNIIGTYNLLEVTKEYLDKFIEKKDNFRFHHISTDEVFGDLINKEDFFKEDSPYKPSSPYSASKASSDHLVRAWGRTYNLPYVITNCSNNYGPYHFPEKLIPVTIINAIQGRKLPIYGDGSQIRDWLFVDDHVKALYKVATQGKVNETYNIGGHNEKTNLEVVSSICNILEDLNLLKPNGIKKYTDLITFIKDRPGHDLRYAIDATKIKNDLGWLPEETFESGLLKTVQWYINNKNWWKNILDGSYYCDLVHQEREQ